MDFHRCFLSCTSFHSSRILQSLLLILGSFSYVLLATYLINLYSRLCDLPAAAATFTGISKKNIFSWNSMISAFVRHNSLPDALLCFLRLLAETELLLDSFTFLVAVKSCGTPRDLQMMHSLIERPGFTADLFVATYVMSGYLRSGSVEDATKVFAEMPRRDSGCWDAMIAAYEQFGDSAAVLEFLNFVKMRGLNLLATTLRICKE